MSLPVVCLHGWGLHGGLWSDLVRRLPGRVLAPDLPGHGGAPLPVGGFRLDALVQWAGSLVEGPALWVAWSLGALVALSLAAARPRKVAGLVLVGATPCFVARPCWPAGLAPAVLEGFARDLEADYRGTVRRFLSLQVGRDSAGRELLRRLRREAARRPAPRAEVLRGGLTLLREVDLRPALAAVRAPAAVVHGTRDRLVPVAAGRYLAVRLQAAWRPVPRAGHAPLLSHPDRVAAAVAELRGGPA